MIVGAFGSRACTVLVGARRSVWSSQLRGRSDALEGSLSEVERGLSEGLKRKGPRIAHCSLAGTWTMVLTEE